MYNSSQGSMSQGIQTSPLAVTRVHGSSNQGIQTFTGFKRLEQGGTQWGKAQRSDASSNCTMAPRKPKPPASANPVASVECTPGAGELTSTLDALLQLDLSSAGPAPELLHPQLVKLVELILQTSLTGLWETSKKRLPLALSNICDWALLQETTPFDIVDGAAEVFSLCLLRCPKDKVSADAQALAKKLLRLDVPCKLFRVALAAHERAHAGPCLAHDMGLPPDATPASGGYIGSKAWAIQLASAVATSTQTCIASKALGTEVHMQLLVQSRSPAFVQSVAQLCKLAFEMSGVEAHGEDWAVADTLRIDSNALSIAMLCGDLLAYADINNFSQGGGPAPEAQDLPLVLMQGLLESLSVTIKAQRRLAFVEQPAGLYLHLSFISTAMHRLMEMARARWLQPSSGLQPPPPPRQSAHDPRAAAEPTVLGGLYRAAWQALCITEETSPAHANSLPKIHTSAARIMYHVLNLPLLANFSPPPPLLSLANALKSEQWGFHCGSEHHDAASARTESLGHLLRLAALLATETSIHSGDGLSLETGSAAALPSPLIEYGALPKLWPVLATFRRAANAVIASKGFSPSDSAILVEGLADALTRLLLCTKPWDQARCSTDGDGLFSRLTEPRGGRTTVICLELLPAICSVAARGIRTAMRDIGDTVSKIDVEEAKRDRQLITTAAAGSDPSLQAGYQLLEILPVRIATIGVNALMAVMTACSTALLAHRRRRLRVAAVPSTAPCDVSGNQSADDACCFGALAMLLVLRASPVGTLLRSVAACLELLFPLALCVLAGSGPSEPAGSGQQQQQQPGQPSAPAKTTSLGGKRLTQMRDVPSSRSPETGDDTSASKMSVIVATVTLHLLRLAILCLGSLLELGAAAVEEASEGAAARGSLEEMHAASGIVRDWLHDTGLLRVVTSRDAVQLLYGVLQEGTTGGQQQFESDWKLLLAERQRPGSADLLPVLLLGVAESQASCCRALVRSLSGCGEHVEAAKPSAPCTLGLGEGCSDEGEERLRSQWQLFDAAANDSAGLAERLAIHCAMLTPMAAAVAAPCQVSGAAGLQLGLAALELLAVTVREAAGLGLRLAHSLQAVFDGAFPLQLLQAVPASALAHYADEASPPSIDDVRELLEPRQVIRMACLRGYADWGLLSKALVCVIDSRRPLSALTDALVSSELDPDTLNTEMVALGRMECGSSACPNAATWSEVSEGAPCSWRVCKTCCSIFFCCQACEDDANRMGHKESCSILYVLNPSSRRPQREEEEGGSSSSEEGGLGRYVPQGVVAGNALGVSNGAPPLLRRLKSSDDLHTIIQEMEELLARVVGTGDAEFEPSGGDPLWDAELEPAGGSNPYWGGDRLPGRLCDETQRMGDAGDQQYDDQVEDQPCQQYDD